MALNVAKELAALERMTVRELRETYAELFGEQTRSGNKHWLVKRLIWRRQAIEHGDLSERARQRAMELADDRDLRLKAPRAKPSNGSPRSTTVRASASADPRLPIPGTVLTRKYKGETLKVTVLESGFEFAGEVYGSLSAVAKTITGSHTNGFLFFRLNGKGGGR